MTVLAYRSQRRKSRMALALASALAVGLSLGAGAEDGQADQPLPAMTIGYQSGTITAVHETNFEIDGRTYGFTPDAVIVDEEGNPMEPASVLLKAAVKFHVKNDQRDKIDRMVLVLPK